MLTIKQFDELEKRHQELMQLIDEQLAIVDSVHKMNPIKFMLDHWFYHRSRNAMRMAKKYLREGEKLIDSL